jgi:hypothetical protein
VTIERLQAHYGLTRMPFGRNLAPGMLHRHHAHNEAVARITWELTPDLGHGVYAASASKVVLFGCFVGVRGTYRDER